ncbi:MAG: hypothetical protein IKI04_02320 [Bacilli bacterium]|nr:hypothetical protein [Bacilli bacterium]
MTNENDLEMSKYNIKSLIVIALIVVVMIGLGTYAWITYRSKNTAMVLTIGDLNNVQITLKPYQLELELSPMLTYTSLDTSGDYVTVSVVNNSTTDKKFSLFYDIHEIDSGLQNSNFRYTIKRTNDNNLTEGNFASASTSGEFYILEDATIPANTTYNYRVYTWLYSNGNQQSGLSFKGDLRAEIGSNPIPKFIRKNAVIDNISSTYVTNTNGIQFDDISSDTNGKGIYIRSGTENNQYPIYYYRGAVDNNNVLFGGFCWKIVRTTDTGGIKMIYNGVPSNGECNNTGTDSQLSTKSSFNNSYNSPADVGYMYGTRYTCTQMSSADMSTSYKYGNSFTYSNGTYTLVDTIDTTGTWSTDYNTLNNNHYTCLNTTGTCTSIYYVYYTANYTSSGNAYYITLTNGKSTSNLLDETLTNSSNETSSAIRTTIDNWFGNNMTNYTSYLEDTIYCNDRNISSLGGLDPNGGSTSDYLYFSSRTRAFIEHAPSITCASKNDSFTVMESATGNGALTYPVGLLTADETILAGGKNGGVNSSYYLYSEQIYWLMSPNSWLGYGASGFYVNAAGNITADVMSTQRGVRPVVSLKPGTQFSGGDGTSANPYVVSMS